MQSPFNPLAYVVLGLLTASLPYFGFPSAWETVFEVALGGFLVTIGIAHWWQNRSMHAHEADTFVESRREEHFKAIEAVTPRVTPSPMSDVSIRHTPSPTVTSPTPSPVAVAMPAPRPAPSISSMADVVSPAKSAARDTSVAHTTPRTAQKVSKPKAAKTPQKIAPSQPAPIPSPVRIRNKRRSPTKTPAEMISR